jgi:hypothetical protein
MSNDNSDWEGFFGFKPNQVFNWLLNCPCKIVCLFTGNQFGKNENVEMDYNMRILGMHPNPSKNVVSTDHVRTFRFASQSLPSEKDDTEVKNTQYPVLKRRFPNSLITNDITVRKPVVTVKSGDGKTCQIEFVSFSQDVQSGAGVQRRSIWIDEECNRDFYEEQIPRLLAADGDIIFSFTPVPGAIGWEYDELYERARMIYRTQAVRDRIKERTGVVLPEIQMTESADDIAVIMAATDDNPVYAELAARKSKILGKTITAKEYIDSMFAMYDDPDVVDARRYGLFRQLSGRIYKGFNPQIHVIDFHKYFEEIPSAWKNFRGIDYHQSNPWAIVWASMSPENELFIWKEYAPTPGKITTYDIVLNMAHMSGDHKYVLDLIDPLANETQVNTNFTTVEDINRYLHSFKREGLSTGGFFHTWDTKGTRGREELQMRLSNATRVGKPLNNKVVEGDGSAARAKYLPTVWIANSCKLTIESLKNWRLEEWKSREMQMERDQKEKAQVKYSHFPVTIECLLKNPLVSSARFGSYNFAGKPKRYMIGRL